MLGTNCTKSSVEQSYKHVFSECIYLDTVSTNIIIIIGNNVST